MELLHQFLFIAKVISEYEHEEHVQKSIGIDAESPLQKPILVASTSMVERHMARLGPDKDRTEQAVDVSRLVLDKADLLYCFQEDGYMELSPCIFCKYTIASFQ